MEYKGGSIIKYLREEMGVTQEELAKRLYISQRQLSRVENGEAELDWLEFLTAFSSLGIETDDFWIMFLDVEEFKGYMQYQQLRKYLRNNDRAQATKCLMLLEESPLGQRDFMTQFIMAISCILDEMDDAERMRGLHEALSITIKDFDAAKMDSYNLIYNEIMIISELALLHDKHDNPNLAIDLLYGIVNGLENDRLRLSPFEKELAFPRPIVYLYRLLFREGRYEEAAKVCNIALYRNNLWPIDCSFYPESHYTLAICYKQLGKPADEYIPLLVKAYHTAQGIRQNELARKAKEAYHEAKGK